MDEEETKKFIKGKESTSPSSPIASSFRKDRDEESKKTRSKRNPKRYRCPIYMPRSEDNLLKGKGIELLELLGEGSYSKVYLCKKSDQQQVMGSGGVSYVLALKMVDSSKTSNEYTKKFLPRELSVLMKIRHPNIIRMYMLFQRKSKFYILMRYAERGDLLDYILNHGLITENRARFWTYQISTALEYLHTMNVVHRDIKTENVLITECFNVKLSDFGFSRFIGHEELSSTFCGSISYSAPEILELKAHDAKKSDMWSLGVVIFVMLIKRLPFHETENPKLLLAEQLEKSYIMPPKMEEVLSLPSKKALKHLLQPNPAKRWDIKDLLGSQWMAMDFRLVFRSQKEREALSEAVEIAANRGGRVWNDMIDEHKKIIGLAMENASLQGKKTIEMWRPSDRKFIGLQEDKDVIHQFTRRTTESFQEERDTALESYIKKANERKSSERQEYYRHKSQLEDMRWEQKEEAEWNKRYGRMIREEKNSFDEDDEEKTRRRRAISSVNEEQDEIVMKLLEYQQRIEQEEMKRLERRRTWISRFLTKKSKKQQPQEVNDDNADAQYSKTIEEKRVQIKSETTIKENDNNKRSTDKESKTSDESDQKKNEQKKKWWKRSK